MTNTGFAIQPVDIPRYPQCGSPLVPNIRRDDTFIDKPWIEKIEELNSLVETYKGKNILLLELGAGFTTASIIRYPFELFVLQRKNTELIRINLAGKDLSLLNNSPRTAIIQGDIGPILSRLAEEH
jgi:hypothetical protein